jgi:Cft2 family RNA processing exonuclease
MDLKGRAYCESLWSALSDTLTELLVLGSPGVRVVGRQDGTDPSEEATAVFDQLFGMLVAAGWIDEYIPIGTDRRGAPTLQVPSPYGDASELSRRIKLATVTSTVALLRAFTILRIRFQEGVTTSDPQVRLEAPTADDAAVDSLYFIGDTFTERYPVRADLSSVDSRLVLDLVGEPQPIGTGLGWPRGDYIRSRDAALIFRPLWESIHQLPRSYAIPRRSPRNTVVNVRIPNTVDISCTSMVWVEDLQALKAPPPAIPIAVAGSLGQHHAFAPRHTGLLLTIDHDGTGPMVPVSVLEPVASRSIEPKSDGHIDVWFEGLGGVREIGANAYYYRFGRRGLLIDCGFDATRDGWLGLPALERIARVDAIVLTHAHLDHVGSLPLLLASFPSAVVYCTRATYELLGPTLMDSAKVTRIRYEQGGESPAITLGMVQRIDKRRFRFVNFGETVEIPAIPSLSLTFHDAGHMIGSLYVEMQFQGMSIAHSGDINLLDLATQTGLSLDGKTVDHLVMEGTYGSNTGFGPHQRRQQLREFEAAVAERIDAGGSILIPAFALGRAQEFVALLSDWNRRNGRSIPIRTVGMANRVNELIRNQLTNFMPAFASEAFVDVDPLELGRGRDEEERLKLAEDTLREVAQRGPCLIIASHGMMVEGTSSYLLGRAILTGTDERLAIFLCGYMDPRTPGFRLLHHGHHEVIDYGENDRIRRTIPAERIAGYHVSSHASFEELLQVAQAVPRTNLILVHGDGTSLDNLQSHIEALYRDQNRSTRVCSPGMGSRFALGQVPAPDGWNEENEGFIPADDLAPGRRFDRRTGFAVSGLTEDGRVSWALIPVGRSSVHLTMQSESVAGERVRRFALPRCRFHGGVVLYDRDQDVGDWRRFDWKDIGRWTFTLTFDDSDGQAIQSELPLLVGNQLQASRVDLDANDPILELTVGGTLAPQQVALETTPDRCSIPVRDFSWNAETRVLSIYLSPCPGVGVISGVKPWIRWSNGFPQNGPTLGDIALEPRIRLDPLPLRVGRASAVTFSSSPPVKEARLDVTSMQIQDHTVTVMPVAPGEATLWFAFDGIDHETVWRQAAVFNVQAAADIQLPQVVERGRPFDIAVTGVASDLPSQRVSLFAGAELLVGWRAGATTTAISHTVTDDIDELVVELRLSTQTGILARAQVQVLAGLSLDSKRSQPVTSADGELQGALEWRGMHSGDHARVEEALCELGFASLSWQGDRLFFVGSIQTLGRRILQVADHGVPVTIWTFQSCEIALTPSGPYAPGSVVHLSVGGEPILDSDSDVLRWEVDRIAPVMDDLSARLESNHLQLLHPGRYCIALLVNEHRIAESDVDVTTPVPLAPPPQHDGRQCFAQGQDKALITLADIPKDQPVILLVDPNGDHWIAAGPLDVVTSVGWTWIQDRLPGDTPLMICYPCQGFPEVAGRWLSRLRNEHAEVHCANLTYPAPRGEVTSGPDEARRLRQYRVLCSLPAHATIDRGDAYQCPSCGGRQHLQTDSEHVWLSCTHCGSQDRKTVLTLKDLRANPVRALLGEHRIISYLTRGAGLRYGGVFARTVRCSTCQRLQPAYQRPTKWDAAYLQRILRALAPVWQEQEPARSVNRAAWRVAQQDSLPAPDAHARIKADILRLVDAGVIVDGVGTSHVEALEQGKSICCHARLRTWRRPISRLYVGIEALYASGNPAYLHPRLPAGDDGLRALIEVGA